MSLLMIYFKLDHERLLYITITNLFLIKLNAFTYITLYIKYFILCRRQPSYFILTKLSQLYIIQR